MILKKSQFKFQKKYRGKWPFSVPEVGIVMMNINQGTKEKPDFIKVFAVLHNFGLFALSGALESQGFAKLDVSGIWADEYKNKFIYGTGHKKSLSPLFEFLQEKTR